MQSVICTPFTGHPEERLELVSQVMSGKSCVSVAIEAGIQDRLLYQWVQNYKTKGYNGLVEMKKGRPSKGVPQMKKEEARPLNESEREELIRLRAENEYIKAENEVIKKRDRLERREARSATQGEKAAIIGLAIGGRIDRRFDEKRVKKAVIIVFIIGGISILVKALLFRT